MTLRTPLLAFLFLGLSSTAVLAACDDDDDTGSKTATDGGTATDAGGKGDGGAGAGDGGGGGGGNGCGGLCTGAGFSGGTEEDFGDVLECTCTGTGTGIAKTACEKYCAPLAPEKALLSSQNSPNDKCVCDGT